MIGLIIAANLLAALVAVVTNLATDVVPEQWRPYLWIAWPVLGLLVLCGIPVAVRLQRGEAGPRPIDKDRAVFSRQATIARIRTVWIEGVLDRSLYRQNIIDLDLDERPDLLERSWEVVVEMGDEQPRQLNRDIALADVVERHRGLLVLGSPGAGKTTMLLSFLDDLLRKAEQDSVTPIPVVFQLASWVSGPLADWFVTELCGPLYGIPPDLAHAWIENDRVLPLLDGLDEVAPERRLACARAIDGFHRGHAILPMIVSSRIADYDALGLRFSLSTALLIQPLTRTQTTTYLDRLGKPLAGLREAMDREPSLWELLRTPFLLSVAVRAYHGLPATDVTTEGTLEQRQTDLITAYVERAFSRKRPGPRISAAEAARVLAFVARGLGRSLDTSFYIENVNVGWLPTGPRRVVMAAVTILEALLLGATAGLLTGLLFGVGYGILCSVIAAGVLSVVAFSKDGDNPRPRLQGRRRAAVVGDLSEWGLAGGCLAVAVSLVAGAVGLLVGAVIGAIAGPFFDVLGRGGLIGMTIGGLLGLLIPVAASSTYSVAVVLHDRSPGAGLRDALWFTVVMAGIVGVPATIGLLAVIGWPGALIGLGIGLTGGYAYGGQSVVAYWLGRFLLARAGVVPWRLRSFLDFAVDHTVMLKVGGGYLFTHRLLLEYFASLEPDGVRTSYLHGGLPMADLRPHALLTRAVREAPQEDGNSVRLLAYTRSLLPADVWAPAAMDVATVLEYQLEKSSDYHDVRDPIEKYDQIAPVLEVLGMIIAVEHPQYAAMAALRLGQRFVTELTDEGLRPILRTGIAWSQAETALETIAASGSPSARRAAALLAYMRDSDR